MPGHSSAIHRLVVLGHTGFVGRQIAQRMRLLAPAVELIGRSLPEVDLQQLDHVRRLAPLLNEDTVLVVCAAIKRQFGDSLALFEQNLQMIVNLCELLQEHPVGRVVYISSAAVYGEEIDNPDITESTPVHPTSYYGVAKLASEELLRMTVDRSAGGFLAVRPPLIYGPADEAGGYGPSGFLRAAIRHEPITLWGDGSETREFLFVEDAADLLCRLSLHSCSGVVNLASGRSYSYQDAVSVAAGLVGRQLQVASRPRTKPQVNHGFRNERLRRLVPEFQFTALEQGMRNTLEIELPVHVQVSGCGGGSR